MKKQFTRKYPFSFYLVGSIFLILFMAVVALISVSYLATEETLNDNARTLRQQTEQNFITAFQMKNAGLRLYEDSLNRRMEKAFTLFLAEYENAGRDPSGMNLERVKSEIGGEMELYVIDSTATVVYTTYSPDLGLQFRDYAPYFADYLDEIRRSEGFFPDRIVTEKSSTTFRKYAYMPTPDHRFVLELGLAGDEINYPLEQFSLYDEQIANEVTSQNPHVENVRIFDVTLRQRINDTSVEIEDEGLRQTLAAVLLERRTLEQTDPVSKNTRRYIYVDLQDENYGSDVSRILEITYTTAPVREALQNTMSFYLSIGIAALVLCSLLALGITRQLTRPISGMVKDLDAIAGGDLDHSLTPPLGSELLQLEESITKMVATLKTTIEELRTSERRYRDVVEDQNEVLFRIRLDGTLIFVNRAYLRLLGARLDEVIGKPLTVRLHPSDEKDVIRGALALTPENPVMNRDVRVFLPNGDTKWFHISIRVIFLPGGNVSEFQVSGVDLTEQKLAELALKESEEKYRTLIQSANSIILRLKPDGTITFMNKFGTEFFGFPMDDLIGKNVVGTILPEKDRDGRIMTSFFRDVTANPAWYRSVENENITREGKRVWISWTNKPLYDPEGGLIELLSIGNDITLLKQAEEEIQKLNNELEERVILRTQQLEEVNRDLESFTYSVSHDLRAPLRAISGYSSILLSELKGLSPRDRTYLEVLRQNAHEMGRLIDDLLNFSRLGRQSLKKERVYPERIIRQIIPEFLKDPSNQEVEFLVYTLPPCQADAGLLKQVYFNLLSNAIKFTRLRKGRKVEIGARELDGTTVYYIRDNGIGFDMKYSGKIFGVFQRLHTTEEYEGTGVGLAIVQRIIDLHGGRIWVESEVDQGTTFFFTCGRS
ncbi:MAG: PAS domain S-box protein [Methanolinea sp.]|nr:PAS domain S-box protein [Methanolinea sp.]